MGRYTLNKKISRRGIPLGVCVFCNYYGGVSDKETDKRVVVYVYTIQPFCVNCVGTL